MLLEPMEERRVLTFAMFDSPMGDWEPDPEWVADQVRSMHSGQVDDTEMGDFQSEDELQAALESLAVDYWEELFGEELSHDLPHRYPHILIDTVDVRLDSITALPASTLSRDLTNVRVPGIDEADSAEFLGDGQLLVAYDGRAQLYDISDPENIEFLSSIELEGYNHRFLTSGDTLFIVSGGESITPRISPAVLRWAEPEYVSAIQAYDLSNVADPTLLASYELDGSIDTAHVIGSQLVIGTQSRANIPDLEIVAVEGEEDSFRFETEQEYLGRVSAQLVHDLLPTLSELDANGDEVASTAIGDFQDVHLRAEGERLRQFGIWTFDASAEDVPFVEGETVVGPAIDFAYVDQDFFYAVQNSWQTIDQEANIYSFSFDDSNVTFEASGSVPGAIRSAHAMDEHQGTLRVFTTGGITALDQEPESNLFLLQPGAESLSVVGELLDLAPDQSHLGSVFDGDYAYVTTGDITMVNQELIAFDPLHVLDLSNPEEPIELSELDIPGFASTLRRVDDAHLVGFGWNVDDGFIRRQVTLYDVSDSQAPTVVENWVGEEDLRGFGVLGRILRNEEMNVRYDAESGLLIADGSPFGVGVEVFHIDPSATEPVQYYGQVLSATSQTRSFIVDNQLVVSGGPNLEIYDLDNLDSPVGSTTVSNPLRADSFVITDGLERIPPLVNDRLPEGSVITSVTSEQGNEHGISEDGQWIILNPRELSEFATETLEYEVTLPDGHVFTSSIYLHYMSLPPQAKYSDASILIDLRATDEEGNSVTEVDIGDKVWITISADRDGFNDRGVFAAYFDVLFDTQVFEVVAQEALGTYTNGIRGTVTDTGIALLGGFTGETQGTGGPNDIVRFQVEVTGEGTLDIVAKASESTDPLNEILTFGDNDPVDPAKVRAAKLQLQRTGFEKTDINQDGETTAVDALILTNHLNSQGRSGDASNASAGEGEFSMEQMDVNGDDRLSAIDILMVINRLNQGNTGSLKGEGEASVAMADELMGWPVYGFDVDSIFDDAEEEITIQPNGGPTNLGQLAGAHSSIWNLNRRR